MCVSDQILMTFAPCDLIPFVDNEGYPVLQQVTLGGCLKKKKLPGTEVTASSPPFEPEPCILPAAPHQ